MASQPTLAMTVWDLLLHMQDPKDLLWVLGGIVLLGVLYYVARFAVPSTPGSPSRRTLFLSTCAAAALIVLQWWILESDRFDVHEKAGARFVLGITIVSLAAWLGQWRR